MTSLEATVEIVKAILSGGPSSNTHLLEDQTQQQKFLKGIEALYATIKTLEGK